MEELARQIQSHVDACNDSDNVSWSDSRFCTSSRRAGDSLVPSLRRHVAESAQRRFRRRKWWSCGRSSGDGAAGGGKVNAASVANLTKGVVEDWRARLPDVLGSFRKFSMIARMLVALLVIGQSSGK